MKKSTIKKVRRFMAENNVAIYDVVEILPILGSSMTQYFNVGYSLFQGDNYAPQWVHNKLRKILSLPKFTSKFPTIPWWEIMRLHKALTGEAEAPYFGLEVNPESEEEDDDYDDWEE